MMKCKMCPVHMVAMVLALVGALNWGLVGAFNFNLVSFLVGRWEVVERVVYILVGLSAVIMAFACSCKKCCQGMCACKDGKCECDDAKVMK